MEDGLRLVTDRGADLVDGGGEGGPQHGPHPVDPVEGEVAQDRRGAQAGARHFRQTNRFGSFKLTLK